MPHRSAAALWVVAAMKVTVVETLEAEVVQGVAAVVERPATALGAVMGKPDDNTTTNEHSVPR